MTKLFLDDIRFPSKSIGLLDKDEHLYKNDSEWVIVRNYIQFVDYIKRHGLPDYISFDHDLADVHYEVDFQDWELSSEQLGVEETGMDCAHWLVNYCLDNGFELPDFQVHSANPAGRDNINGLLNNFKKHQAAQ